MISDIRYTIFKTRWGHFGFVCIDDSVCCTCLPMPDHDSVREKLDLDPEACHDKGLFPELQKKIIAYYEGQTIDFRKDPSLTLTGRGPFAVAVLNACRKIPFGRTETYTSLAEKINRPGAARAVGTALARNPIPLIVPCHRVLRTDGGLGGFSAFGGTDTKQKMILHETSA